jgi:hypothetical protein
MPWEQHCIGSAFAAPSAMRSSRVDAPERVRVKRDPQLEAAIAYWVGNQVLLRWRL